MKTNLEAGRVRLVFVADAIPVEVRRVIEFLNDQMNPAEVLGIEVKQYLGDAEGVRTLVPRVLGQTTRAQGRKRARSSKGPKIDWNEELILEEIGANGKPDDVAVAKRIMEWMRTRPFESGFIGGPVQGSQCFELPAQPKPARLLYIHSRGSSPIGLSFDRLKKSAPFASEEARRELANQFERINGVTIPDERLGRGVGIPLHLLQDEASLQALFEALDWFVDNASQTSGEG